MITEARFSKAERHMDVCEICFDMGDYPFIEGPVFLAMYSVIKAFICIKKH